MTRDRAYLSICAVYRDEASYLREWIEFHRLVGVERFFLYDNLSEDEHREVLAPYVQEGIAVVQDWPIEPPGAHLPAFAHCLEHHRERSRWIAFIDLDEFLFSPTGRKVSDVLTDFEEFPAVGVNWAVYGTSGHVTRPRGLVIESYLWRAHDPSSNDSLKSIVDPARTVGCGANPHCFEYADGALAVNENREPITGPPFARNPCSFSLLRINHYVTKSEEEFRRKSERSRLHSKAGRPQPNFRALARRLHQARDDSILIYLPALKEAIAAGEQAAVASGTE